MIGSSLARRVGLVGMLALLVSALPLAMASAQPDPTPDQDSYVDLDADTNVGYSVRWSQFTFESADEVLIGREDLFPDNLASGSLQGQGDGRPLLLTPSDALAQQVIDEIARLGATTVHILGGEEAISGPVEDELEGLVDNVERHFGETRIETAIAISELVPSDTVIVARAFANDDPTQAFADSLAAGAWAADAGFPILLTQTEVLTENTATALADGGYTNAFVVGGEAAIDSTTFDAIDEIVDNVERVGGANRFETAVLIANERNFASADDAEVTVLTDGQGGAAWADGFSAAAFAALHDAPLVLSNSASDSLPPETVEFLSGAPAFAQDATANDLDPDVGLVCGPSVPDGPDDPTDPDAPDAAEADQCGEAAALLGLTTRVDFGDPTAVTADPLTVESGGTVTISGLEGAEEVLVGGDCVDDETDETANVADDGTLEVTITADPGTCTLVVTVDGEEHEFEITVTEPAGQSGVVTACDGANDRFTFSTEDESVTVNYDTANDTFTIDGAPATGAAFENPATGCSPGDLVTVTDNADGTQTIALTNRAPGDINEGTIGNIDISTGFFDIIDPVTGIPIRTAVDYTPPPGATYSTDGANVVQTAFEADLHEGDTVVITPAEGSTPAHFALTNQSTSGEVTGIDTLNDLVEINDALGDDPLNAQNVDYDYTLNSTFTVNGVTATVTEFEAALSLGDTLTVTRNDGQQVFALVNAAPPVSAGDLTETFVPAGAGGTVTIIPADSTTRQAVAYSAGSQFVVNGATATEAEFEAALSPGDDITYQAADPAPGTGTVERITLTTDTLNANCTPDGGAGDPTPCSVPDDVNTAADTYDVENPTGGIIYDNLNYVTGGLFGGPNRYLLNGAEVTLAQFETALTACQPNATTDCTIEVARTAVATEHRLTDPA